MSGTNTPNATGISFNEMIQADRKKRKDKEKYEALAQSILGGGKRPSGPGVSRKIINGPGASLASRVGITKRSSSTNVKPSIDGTWRHDLHHVNARASRPSALQRTASASQLEQGSRSYNASQNVPHSNPTTPLPSGPGMSIKGAASSGPFVVVASNFAPGTSAADIEAAMEPVGGAMISCRVVSAAPTVMAEMVFVDKAGAENVIATFNNQKADGRLLYVFMKQGGPSPILATPPTGPASMMTRSAPIAKSSSAAPQGARDLMEIDDGPQANRSERRRAEPTYEDGRFGFDNAYGDGRGGYTSRDYRRDRNQRGLYSDGNRSYRP